MILSKQKANYTSAVKGLTSLQTPVDIAYCQNMSLILMFSTREFNMIINFIIIIIFIIIFISFINWFLKIRISFNSQLKGKLKKN